MSENSFFIITGMKNIIYVPRIGSIDVHGVTGSQKFPLGKGVVAKLDTIYNLCLILKDHVIKIIPVSLNVT